MRNLYFYLLVAVLGVGCGKNSEKNMECLKSLFYCKKYKADVSEDSGKDLNDKWYDLEITESLGTLKYKYGANKSTASGSIKWENQINGDKIKITLSESPQKYELELSENETFKDFILVLKHIFLNKLKNSFYNCNALSTSLQLNENKNDKKTLKELGVKNNDDITIFLSLI